MNDWLGVDDAPKLKANPEFAGWDAAFPAGASPKALPKKLEVEFWAGALPKKFPKPPNPKNGKIRFNNHPSIISIY